jgi:glycosyltransferase involved in cell wall biosynthesis
MMQEKPLVSTIVVCYNAEKSILETLNSIKDQSYSPIELIISDDCSSDNTVKLCKEWLSENENKFTNCKLFANPTNLGVSANANQAINATSGIWIKPIGDDILLPDCIENNINYANETHAEFVASQMIKFDDKTKRNIGVTPSDKYIPPKTNTEQFQKHLKTQLYFHSPSWFLKKEVYDIIGGYDESLPLSDDMPFLFNFLKQGGIVSYMNKVTVRYRYTSNSLSNPQNKTSKQKQPFFTSRSAYYRNYIVPELKRNKMYLTLYSKNLIYYFYEKKIYFNEHSFQRYIYGAIFTLLSKFQNF